MIWSNVQRLARVIANQGVQDPGPVDLVGPVQTVQLVDDASLLSRRVDVAHGWMSIVAAAAGAGIHTGLQIGTALTAGVYVRNVRSDTASGDYLAWATRGVNAGVTVTAATPLVSARPPLAGYSDVTIPLANIPAGRAHIDMTLGAVGVQTVPLDYFLQPGDFFYFVHATANTAAAFAISVMEVPA